MRMLILVAFVVIGASGAGHSAPGPAPAPRDASAVEIQAERFQFTPSEIKATVGNPLTIKLTSDDTDHGFRILGTTINVAIPKRSRGSVTVTFTPEKAGRYTFECSHVCGAGHAFMRGVVVVAASSEGAR